MDRERIKKLLEDVREGKIAIDDGVQSLSAFPYEDLEFARVDHHRSLRLGFPEVILGEAGPSQGEPNPVADAVSW